MKKIFLVFSLFISLFSGAQTVDEVVQKYTSAMGGLDAFKKVQSAKITATVSVQGLDLPATIQIINGKAMRTDVEAMGQAVVNVYKDGKAWAINPFNGMETATDVEGTELMNLKAQASLASNLMDYKAQGHTAELQGQEDVEGIKTWKIKLTAKEDSRITYYYISVADNMIVKSTGTRNVQGEDVEVETWYSDTKEFAGLKFNMVRTQKISGQVIQTITYTNVELNVQVEEKIFDK